MGRAANELAAASHALLEGDWPSATMPLAESAVFLSAAAASMSDAITCDGLHDAAREIDDAASVTGCIALAAAAGPSLQAAAEALSDFGDALVEFGSLLESEGATSSHADAGQRVQKAARAASDSAKGLATAGVLLEEGRLCE